MRKPSERLSKGCRRGTHTHTRHIYVYTPIRIYIRTPTNISAREAGCSRIHTYTERGNIIFSVYKYIMRTRSNNARVGQLCAPRRYIVRARASVYYCVWGAHTHTHTRVFATPFDSICGAGYPTSVTELQRENSCVGGHEIR